MKKRIVFAFVLFILFASLVLVSSQTIDKDAVNTASSGLKEDVKAEVNQTFTIVKGVIGGLFDKLGTWGGDIAGRVFGWKTLSGEIKIKVPDTPNWFWKSFVVGGIIGLLYFFFFVKSVSFSFWQLIRYFILGGLLIPFTWLAVNSLFLIQGGREYMHTGIALSVWIFLGYMSTGLSQGYAEYVKAIRARPATHWKRYFRFPDKINIIFYRWRHLFGNVGVTLKESEGYSRNSFEFLGDQWWKYLYFILLYPIVMVFVPGLNRIISLVTLEALGSHWFVTSMVIAFEIALLPQMVKDFLHYTKYLEAYENRVKQKTYEKMSEAAFD